jgi:hypothetical protein
MPATKVTEIKKKLSDLGVQNEDFKGKKAKELETLLKDTERRLSTISDVVDESPKTGAAEEKDVPLMFDPEWTAYVLDQLEDDEKVDGEYPKLDGLRRLSLKLLGAFSTYTTVDACPGLENSNRATVSILISFLNDTTGRKMREVSAAADCCRENTEATYARHPVATAESRAEGRALKKALFLKNVHTAEEMSAETKEDNEQDKKATEGMVKGIEMMAANQKIDFDKLLVEKQITENKDTLTVGQLKEVSKILNEYVTSPDTIPEGVKL